MHNIIELINSKVRCPLKGSVKPPFCSLKDWKILEKPFLCIIFQNWKTPFKNHLVLLISHKSSDNTLTKTVHYFKSSINVSRRINKSILKKKYCLKKKKNVNLKSLILVKKTIVFDLDETLIHCNEHLGMPSHLTI